MAHMRVRAFNTKDTYPEQNLDNDLAQAVIAGNTMPPACHARLGWARGRLMGIGNTAATA